MQFEYLLKSVMTVLCSLCSLYRVSVSMPVHSLNSVFSFHSVIKQFSSNPAEISDHTKETESDSDLCVGGKSPPHWARKRCRWVVFSFLTQKCGVCVYGWERIGIAWRLPVEHANFAFKTMMRMPAALQVGTAGQWSCICSAAASTLPAVYFWGQA